MDGFTVPGSDVKINWQIMAILVAGVAFFVLAGRGQPTPVDYRAALREELAQGVEDILEEVANTPQYRRTRIVIVPPPPVGGDGGIRLAPHYGLSLG